MRCPLTLRPRVAASRACLPVWAFDLRRVLKPLRASAMRIYWVCERSDVERLHFWLEYGEEALTSARRKAITPAFEHIVETNTLLSGLGFESCGLAAGQCVASIL